MKINTGLQIEAQRNLYSEYTNQNTSSPIHTYNAFLENHTVQSRKNQDTTSKYIFVKEKKKHQ